LAPPARRCFLARATAGDGGTKVGRSASGWFAEWKPKVRLVAFVGVAVPQPDELRARPGADRVPPYVVTSLVCMAPGAIAYTWLGHAGREALAGDTSAIRYGLLALGLLAVIAFLPPLFGAFRPRAVDWIEPEHLHRQIEDGAALTVLDVRGADEFAGALGIFRTRNIPLGELDQRLDVAQPGPKVRRRLRRQGSARSGDATGGGLRQRFGALA
jgi:hypothetical protein